MNDVQNVKKKSKLNTFANFFFITELLLIILNLSIFFHDRGYQPIDSWCPPDVLCSVGFWRYNAKPFFLLDATLLLLHFVPFIFFFISYVDSKKDENPRIEPKIYLKISLFLLFFMFVWFMGLMLEI